jgi:hypothetical protein
MRDLTGIPDDTLNSEGGQLAYFHFVKLTFPSPTGVLRFTTYPADSYIGDIDGASQTWDGTRPMRVTGLGYGRDTPLSDASVEFGNLDDYFSALRNTHGVLRGMPVSIYRAHFEVTAGPVIGDLYRSHLVFKGQTDRASLGDTCGLALLPSRPPWASLFPKRRITTVNFPFLSRPDIIFNWGDSSTNVGNISHATGVPGGTGWENTPTFPFTTTGS